MVLKLSVTKGPIDGLYTTDDGRYSAYLYTWCDRPQMVVHSGSRIVTRGGRPAEIVTPGDVWEYLTALRWMDDIRASAVTVRRVRVTRQTDDCDRCSSPMVWIIDDGIMTERLCNSHAHEWYPTELERARIFATAN